jgi:hypothetical protein
MYGRETFSQEAGISECNARTRMKHLINLGYVEKITKKSTIKYSVYRLVKEAYEYEDRLLKIEHRLQS